MSNRYIYFVILLLLLGCGKEESVSLIKKNVQEVVFASGVMEMENEYFLSAKVDGILTQLNLKEGDSVTTNQTIAMLNSDVQKSQLNESLIIFNDSKKNALPSSPQLQNLKAQIDQAQKQLSFDKEQYNIYKDLRDKKSVSQIDYEKKKLQFETSKSNLLALQENYDERRNSLQLSVQRNKEQVNIQQTLLNDYTLIAKGNGIIINVFKEPGELVRRGEEVLKIGNGDYIIKLFVSEEDITKIELNQTVIVSINTYLDRTFKATVSKIYPGFDESEQSYIIEARFDELPEKLFSGTQLQANIQTKKKYNVLLIPTSFLKNNKVMLENGELIPLEIGYSDSEWTEVKSGITVNDVIVKQ
jgi:multidrug efflux pump subunit AcrA (membrane-fusion protein)